MNTQPANNKANGRTGLRRILAWFYVICGIALILDLVLHRHYEHPWEWLPFFYCMFGFVACVVLVVVAKYMRNFLMRSEKYYDGTDS